MKWVYVLNLQQSKLYIGETERLYGRLIEHMADCGSEWTRRYEPRFVQSLYNVENDVLYRKYSEEILQGDEYIDVNYIRYCIKVSKADSRNLENDLTLTLMKKYGNFWNRIRGGVYCRIDIENNPSQHHKISRPMCFCNDVAEINFYHDKLYFRCSKKGKEWYDNPFIRFTSKDHCNFYQQVDKEHNFYQNDFDKFIIDIREEPNITRLLKPVEL